MLQPSTSLGTISNSNKNLSVPNNSNNNLDTQSKSLVTSDKENAVITLGMAVFNKDKMVGTITGTETMCHLLIINELKYCTVNIPNPIVPGKNMDIYISPLRNSKISVNIINGIPVVNADFNVSARIISYNEPTNILTDEKLDLIQHSVMNYLTEQLYNYFNKTSKELSSDISGIGKFAVKNFKTMTDWREYNWLDNYKNANFRVNVETNIKTGLLLTNE